MPTKARGQKPRQNLGVLEGAVLVSVLARNRRSEDASALNLFHDVTAIARRRLTLGSLYFLLDNLQRKGLLRFATRPVADRQGRVREVRFYELSDEGRAAAKTEFESQRSLIDHVAGAIAGLFGGRAHARA